MPIIQYPAAKAVSDGLSDYRSKQIEAFNHVMRELQEDASLGKNVLNVLAVKSFEFYQLGPMFETQGYTVSRLGLIPTLKYIISW